MVMGRVTWVANHPHFRKVIKGGLRARCQHGHQITEEKLGRHSRLSCDLFALSMPRNQPLSQGPLSTSRKYPGCGWSRVYAFQPKPYRGWVLNLILATLCREVNAAAKQF